MIDENSVSNPYEDYLKLSLGDICSDYFQEIIDGERKVDPVDFIGTAITTLCLAFRDKHFLFTKRCLESIQDHVIDELYGLDETKTNGMEMN